MNYEKDKLHIVNTFCTSLSELISRDVALSNTKEKHPNTYRFYIDGYRKDFTIGYEEIFSYRTREDIETAAAFLQFKIKEELIKNSENVSLYLQEKAADIDELITQFENDEISEKKLKNKIFKLCYTKIPDRLLNMSDINFD